MTAGDDGEDSINRGKEAINFEKWRDVNKVIIDFSTVFVLFLDYCLVATE